jgi:hypothetical protein
MSIENHGGMNMHRGKLLTRPPELSGNPTSSHLVPTRKDGGGSDKLGQAKYFCYYFPSYFLHAVTISSHRMYFPSKENRALKKIQRLSRV